MLTFDDAEGVRDLLIVDRGLLIVVDVRTDREQAGDNDLRHVWIFFYRLLDSELHRGERLDGLLICVQPPIADPKLIYSRRVEGMGMRKRNVQVAFLTMFAKAKDVRAGTEGQCLRKGSVEKFSG